MNQVKLVHTESPPIGCYFFCAIPPQRQPEQFNESSKFAATTVGHAITPDTIDKFLSLSRQYLGLDNNF